MADETPESKNPKIPSFKPTRKSGDEKKGIREYIGRAKKSLDKKRYT